MNQIRAPPPFSIRYITDNELGGIRMVLYTREGSFDTEKITIREYSCGFVIMAKVDLGALFTSETRYKAIVRQTFDTREAAQAYLDKLIERQRKVR